ncbi:2-hydroxychromene-2-carboxylate isomerase [Roseovarius arcticus]|uniref:2-hydroxychromene-2-carboxylate isomerase n=1 Tax=Roseovarius arcticus TaxID=2547404 RepID=UPI001FE790E4|nr:DsbA family protein [Roseovarius arcticus]
MSNVASGPNILGIRCRIPHSGILPIIEYIYSAHSAFAYLGSAELSKLCVEYHVSLVHKPVLLSPVVEAQGSQPFRARTQAHVDYFFGREIERWAEYRDVPIINFRPTCHDADYSLASGMILALEETGTKTDMMAHALLEAHWRYDADLSNPQTLAKMAAGLGHDADALMEQAASETVQDKLEENSIWAREQNIFGSPTYIVDGEPFYGQDHLGLVKRALSQPFSASTWSNPPVD